MDLTSLLDMKNRKYAYIIVLLAIFAFAFWVRSLPASYGELQAIDPFYIYRISDYLVNNNMQMMEVDYMRHHPFGVVPLTKDPSLPFYLPAALFMIVGPLTGMTFLQFAIMYPAFMGALAVIIMFFLGRELFDKRTGLFAAFFLAVVPAFITRTSAGFFDKEATAGIIMLLVLYFFFRAYKRNDWRSGILGGVSMLLLVETWNGGFQYLCLLLPIFAVIMMLLNRNLDRLFKAYVPLVVGAFITLLLPYHPPLLGLNVYSGLHIALAILLIRIAVERFKLVKKEQLIYVVPGILVIGFIAMMFSYMFTDLGASYLGDMGRLITFNKGVEFSTVAEANPGSIATIVSSTAASYSSGILGLPDSITIFFSITLLSLAGAVIAAKRLLHKYLKKDPNTNFLLLFLIIWMLSSMWAVLGYIRLLFLLGPPMALLAAFAVGWLIGKVMDMKVMKSHVSWKQKINYVTLPVAVFLVLVVVINSSSAFVYGNSMGPSFNKYWEQAMDFLAEETPENSNILSWWDFGYWFQTRGERPSLTDGGFGKRYDVAIWYIADSKNWTDFEPWLKDTYGIDYILMDYSLPGKYGAISKIGTQAENIVGIMQFNPSQILSQGDVTIQEFKAGAYTLWIPQTSSGELASPPMLLISQNGQYQSKAYINELCTDSGIVRVGDEPQSIGGCVAITGFGVFYVPEEAENTIFSSLMFMEGYDLPVEKVFDNQAIKIFRVEY